MRSVQVEICNMCMICNEANEKVLVQNKNNKNWSGLTFPGGHVEANESIYDSVFREVKEETGLSIDNLELCGFVHWENTDTNVKFMVFLYKTSSFTGILLDKSDEGENLWLSLDEMKSKKMTPNMDKYLEIFLNNRYSEAYATYNEKGDYSEMIIAGK